VDSPAAAGRHATTIIPQSVGKALSPCSVYRLLVPSSVHTTAAKAAGCLALQSRPASSAVVVSVLFAVCMTYAYNTAAPAHAIRRACCQQVHDRAPCGSGCSITRTTNNDSKTARARTAPLMKPNDHRAFKGVAG
jgi:hypothetical protein